MSETDVSVVPAHGGWSDGSSWSKVVAALRSEGVKAVTAPLTSLADDVAALDRMLERVEGPVVVAGNAYAGAVIASTSDERVASLVIVAALAPTRARRWVTSSIERNRARCVATQMQ
jgi:pimeloyl-ACP methyl ester carboxylesterase